MRTRNGWSDNLVNPDGKEEEGTNTKKHSVCSQLPNIPSGNWQTLKDAFVGKAPDQMFSFSNAQIINYFVVRTAVDGMLVRDMNAAQNLFRCGHIQSIRVLFDKHMYVKANCLPEMRKDRVYKLLFFLDLESSNIVATECGYPEGKGPCASCKHNGAI